MCCMMMDPAIQYATTADGVSIAFWTFGDGPVVVETPPHPWSHIGLEWQDPDFRRWYQRIGRGRRIVRYDSRGSGLSDRDVGEYTADGLVLDLEAVVDRLGLDHFTLAGITMSGLTAIAYALRHPERVSALVLWCACASGRGYQSSRYSGALDALRESDWDLFTETIAHAMVAGWAEGDRAHRFAGLMKQAATPESYLASERALRDVDLEPELHRVIAPTLILHRRGGAFPDVEAVRRMASRMPDARVVLLEGEALLPFVGDMENVARPIDDLAGIASAPLTAPDLRGEGGLVAILFTDIEDSTGLARRLGDTGAREVLRVHERITREALVAGGGAEVKTMGDGFLASFASPTRALESAIAMQRAFEAENERLPLPLRVRMGINAGEPIAEADDLFGTPVILAQRICARARGGEILVSDVVRQLVAGRQFLFAERGATALRGFEEPVRLYELHWNA